MLILKGKFLFVKQWTGRCALLCALPCALLCVLLAAPAAVALAQAAGPASAARTAAPQPGRAPEHVAAEFYGWYLDMLFADQDPLSDRHERFTGYVSRELTRQLVLRLQQPPLPELDYFLQARDYRPAWQRNVHASGLRRTRDAAEVLVTLGGDDGPPRALLLTMVQEGGAWKIRRVAPAGGAMPESAMPESSLEEPVI